MAKAGLIFVATDDGIVTLSDPGGSGRYRRIGHALTGTICSAVLARDALHLLAVTTRDGVQASSDSGMHWNPVLAAEIVDIAAPRSDPSRVFAVTAEGDLYRSTDGGMTWEPANVPAATSPLPTPLVHCSDSAAYLVLDDQVYTAAPPSDEWQPLGTPLTGIRGIASTPDGSVLLAAAGALYHVLPDGTRQMVAPEDTRAGGALATLPGKTPTWLAAHIAADGSPQILRSDDSGAGWEPAALEGEPPPAIERVTVLATAGYNRDYAWAGTANGLVLASENRGRGWRTLIGELAPVRAVVATRLI